MARFLIQVAYTPQAWAAQLERPENRIEVLKPTLASVDAKFETAYFAFGEYDIVAVIDAPDNVSAAALSLCFSAGGALRECKTTPLMTIDEGLEAMRKGQRALATYKSPASLTTAGRN